MGTPQTHCWLQETVRMSKANELRHIASKSTRGEGGLMKWHQWGEVMQDAGMIGAVTSNRLCLKATRCLNNHAMSAS